MTIETPKISVETLGQPDVGTDLRRKAGTPVGELPEPADSKTRKIARWYEGYRTGYFC